MPHGEPNSDAIDKLLGGVSALHAWLDGVIARQKFLYANTPKCERCGDEQVELVAKAPPALWKCRDCKHKFSFEPEVK